MYKYEDKHRTISRRKIWQLERKMKIYSGNIIDFLFTPVQWPESPLFVKENDEKGNLKMF